MNNKSRRMIIVALMSGVTLVGIYTYGKPGWRENSEGIRYKHNWGSEYLLGVHQIEEEHYMFGEDYYLDYGWIEYDTKKYYANEEGKFVKGALDVDGITYHFDESTGVLLKGWIEENGIRYYYEEGEKVSGEYRIDGREYYFEENGQQRVGLDIGDERAKLYVLEGTIPGFWEYKSNQYYVNEAYTLVEGLQDIEGKLYMFDSENYQMIKGWYGEEGKRYYFDNQTGESLTGWQIIDEERYYFTDENILANGKLSIQNDDYYFEQGKPVTGWKTLDDGKYYFENHTGVALEGWHTIDNQEYYFTEDKVLANGAMTVANKKYYFTEGVMQTGWKEIGGKEYYYLEEGDVCKGTHVLNGQSYFFLNDGALAEGWVTINGVKYYYKDNKKVVEPTTIGGNVYYFNSDGTISTGWQTVDGKKYYKNQYGANTTGVKTISNKRYYFGNDGVMLTNTTVGLYNINAEGVAIKQPATNANLNLYLDELLAQYGRSIQGACRAAKNTLSYKYTNSQGTTQADAIYALNNRKGACYHYAGLTVELIKRLGYQVEYVEGINGKTGNHHGWLRVKEGGVWIYYDSLYSAIGYTAEELSMKGYKWEGDQEEIDQSNQVEEEKNDEVQESGKAEEEKNDGTQESDEVEDLGEKEVTEK